MPKKSSNLPERLQAILDGRKLTQAGLAETVGLERTQISRWLSGTNAMSQQSAMAFQAALGIRWQWLLHGEGSMLLDSVTAHMPEDLKQLADIWPRLTEKQRQYLLGVAEGIAAAGDK